MFEDGVIGSLNALNQWVHRINRQTKATTMPMHIHHASNASIPYTQNLQRFACLVADRRFPFTLPPFKPLDDFSGAIYFPPNTNRRLSAKRASSLDEALEGIAYEAWRRAAAAVTAATVATPQTDSSPVLQTAIRDRKRSGGAQQASRTKEYQSRNRGASGKANVVPDSPDMFSQQSGGKSDGNKKSSSEMEQRPGFVGDDYLPLDRTDYLPEQGSTPATSRREEGSNTTFGSRHRGGTLSPAAVDENDDDDDSDGDDDLVVLSPMTPLEQLLRLMDVLADGGKVTVADAVAGFGGDAARLGRLVNCSTCSHAVHSYRI